VVPLAFISRSSIGRFLLLNCNKYLLWLPRNTQAANSIGNFLLLKFLEENQQFNVQGSWTGDDGITVSVLVDFGIEDRDLNDYYVGSVSARHEDNLEFLEDHEERELAATTTFREAESALRGAIRTVFDLPRYSRAMSPPEVSDIDTSTTATIDWTHFDIREEVDVPEEAEIEA